MRKYYFLVLNLLFFSGVKAQIVNIPDANFKASLLFNGTALGFDSMPFKIDANKNGEIEVSEALNVKSLYITKSSISSLEGISSFKNLEDLDCNTNQLTTLDVSSLTNLKLLYCQQNQITSLNLSGLMNLESLLCHTNQLPSLNVQGLTKLNLIGCGGNQIPSLDVSGLVNLEMLFCSLNKIPSLNLSGFTKLRYLDCDSNLLTTLDLTGLNSLTELNAGNNPLESLDYTKVANLKKLWIGYTLISTLDLSNLKKLTSFNVSGCPNLEFINLKNGSFENLSYFEEYSAELQLDVRNFSNCPKLKYICGDDSELEGISQKIASYNYTNCVVGVYCSFVPGGTFYTIQGTDKYDSNNNGCDVSDLPLSNLKFSVTDGTNSGSIIANTTGNYTIPVQAGTHTITPVLENPSYFSISPTNTVATFPTQSSPFTQDYCITINGIYPDLEVSVLPINRARAGSDAYYKIIYKNKGTQTQSGSVNLTFDDVVLDFVVSNPIVASQTVNNLSWNFIDLKPFETREITVTVNVNSPQETPAVNSGDVLKYTAKITSSVTDETPTDNTFTLNQTVVNALDPNDKTCLEGTTILPSAVGKYVHYMIRFENKGTAEAQNVVVKDMIDTSKFDISSLIPTKGSHSFVTRITETNKVEFIFENINLPFDDANNDGYIAFKIKTKPSLLVGDSFSNTASIYFDYNFPIITNTTTTSVLQNLGTEDFEFSTYFSVYPNPAKAVLNIDVKKQIELTSISVFNILGQQILVIPNAQKTKQVDVSNLKTGNYFIKVTSDKGSDSGKFVKE